MGDAIGLVIDGGGGARGGGNLPRDQPGAARRGGVRRPLGVAGAARPGRGRGPAPPFPSWAAMAPEERAELVAQGGRRPPAPPSRPQDLATLLTREHGKVLWEAQFDSGTIGGMAGAFAPLVGRGPGEPVADRRRRPPDQRGARALRRGGRRAAVQLAGVGARQQGAAGPARRQHRGGEGAAHLPRGGAGRGRRAGRRAAAGRGERRQRPRARARRDARVAPRRGHGVVHRRRPHRPGRDGRPHRARCAPWCSSSVATTRPSWPPTSTSTTRWRTSIVERRLHHRRARCAWPSSGSTSPRTRSRAMVDALVARVGTEVVGDGLGRRGDHGPGPPARGAPSGSRTCWRRPRRAGARVHRPARVRDEDAGAGGYLVSPGHRGGRARRRPDRVRGAVRAGAPRARLPRRRRGRRAGPTTRPTGCARRSGPPTTSWPPTWPAGSRRARCS